MAARHDSLPGPIPSPLPRIATAADFLSHDVTWPFGKLEGLDVDDVRKTAYEIFAAYRFSPTFSGLSTVMHHSPASQDRVDGDGIGNGSPDMFGSRIGSPVAGRQSGVGIAPFSKVEKALGLKMLNRSQSKKMVS
ncbi:hypothetical protein MLD38_021351 [Melastoma candidum]|uniref:Uncharacterized protein n=1 Tax=Melastoma candidum TaxID=119954 RepID=A0ACB9QJ72_9MYRT|nr:hypothetical protein MLD38_021351 [Melastoma candidum]